MGLQPGAEGRINVAIGERPGLTRIFAQGQSRIEAGLTIARRADVAGTGERGRIIGQDPASQVVGGVAVIDGTVPVFAAFIGRRMDEEDVGGARPWRARITQRPG
ncbi:hypothetical protein D3C86_1645690 [compost metagenome]